MGKMDNFGYDIACCLYAAWVQFLQIGPSLTFTDLIYIVEYVNSIWCPKRKTMLTNWSEHNRWPLSQFQSYQISHTDKGYNGAR